MNVLNLLTLYYLFGRMITMQTILYGREVMEHDVIIKNVDHHREEVTFEIKETRDYFPKTMAAAVYTAPLGSIFTLHFPLPVEGEYDLCADGADDETQLFFDIAHDHRILLSLLDDELADEADRIGDLTQTGVS